MAGDNSFERQMLDFYGINKITEIIGYMFNGDAVKEKALIQIGLDIFMKSNCISKDEMERAKNILQIELYAQLERDRQNANK